MMTSLRKAKSLLQKRFQGTPFRVKNGVIETDRSAYYSSGKNWEPVPLFMMCQADCHK